MKARNIVILGANSDIGKKLVTRAGAAKTDRILAVSRSAARRHLPKGVVALDGIDLTNEEDLRRLGQTTAGLFQTPFAIVHCVGNFWIHKPLTDTPYAEIRQMVESQFLSLCGVARFLTPLMIKNGGGRIVAFSCNSVAYNYPDMSPFTGH
jgi:NAD(P)-dependent dehydrogenase (short-subunit alcohol dehydrogenase family)